MWVIRAILLVLLGAYVGLATLLIRRRERYSRIVENRVSNIALVAIDLVITCALVTLPPAAGWHARPDWLRPGAVRVGFGAAGTALVCAGLGLALCALLQRKVLGLQSAPAGLITSHAYRYFRHPIYTGILWMSLGLALLTRNPDGLMVLPALFMAYVVFMLLEEHDLGVTFGEQYAAYRQTTRRFGPTWLWAAIVMAILLIVVSTRV